MARKPAAKRKMVARKPRRAYHHGDLRRTMVAAALAIVEEGGVEILSVREAARRAGVSSAAPFRHFASRRALLTALAEEGSGRLEAAVLEAVAAAPANDARAQFRALGRAYMRWAFGNPAHFQIVSERRSIDFDASSVLGPTNDRLRALMDRLLTQIMTQARRRASAAEIGLLRIEARALAYGLARMMVDGHFGDWAIPGEAPAVSIERALDDFTARIAAKPGPSRLTPARPLATSKP